MYLIGIAAVYFVAVFLLKETRTDDFTDGLLPLPLVSRRTEPVKSERPRLVRPHAIDSRAMARLRISLSRLNPSARPAAETVGA
jgi:hypothetical protein